jgi:transcription initiation factor TFIID subunit 10
MSDPLSTNETSDNPMSHDDSKMDITVETDVNGKPDTNGNGAQAAVADEEMADQQQSEAGPALQEARIPAKKDATLREFLSKMDDCAPIVCYSLPTYP